MNIDKVKTAVVGCGMISDVYLHNMINDFSILDVVGCCDIKEDLAEQKAQKFSIKSMRMEEVLSNKSIELVINLTSSKVHYSVIKQLLLAGKNVYTEKVFALSLEEAQELVQLADEKGLYLGVAPDTFLGSAIQTGKFILNSGMIGDPTGCLAVLNRDNGVGAEFIPYIIEPGGGIGFDVGIYFITALTYLMGPVSEVAGFMKTRNKDRKHIFPSHENYMHKYHIQSENMMVGSLNFCNGAYGSVQFNSESIMNQYQELTIFGTQGILYMPDPDGFGGEVKVLRRGNPEPFVIQQNHGYCENSRGVGAAEMAWALRNKRIPRANKEMAFHSLEILHGISKSSKMKEFYSLKSTYQEISPLPQGFLKNSQFANFIADQEAALVN